jgi:thiosulfate/3-mercaptopyruvate sulfurtransferase
MFRRLMYVVVFAVLVANAASTTGRAAPNVASMLVQPNWLAAHLADKNLVILHVGADRTSYNAGHIQGARFLALSEIAVPRNGVPNQLPPVGDLKAAFEHLGVGDRSRVVIYGDMFGVLAARAYFTLDYLGHGNQAALLDGGLENWSKEHEVVKAAPADAGATMLTVHPHPEIVVDLPAVRQIISARSAVLIDARSPAEYSGAGPSHGLARAGHIPGAKNLFWAQTLVSRENPSFKPLSEIREWYTAAGIKPGARVIVYCQSGIQATHDYFTLKLTGFQPVLYAGSFADWSTAFGTPVETGSGGQF